MSDICPHCGAEVGDVCGKLPAIQAAEIESLRTALSQSQAREKRMREVVDAARLSVIDRRNEHPEFCPEWADCHCAGPVTEELADALAALKAQEKVGGWEEGE